MVNFQDWIFERLPKRFWDEDTLVVNGKGIFQRFIEAHGYILDTYITPKIGTLTDINTILTTDEAYVSYIAWYLGNPPDTFYDDDKYRKLLRYIIDINKVKGTKLSYELLFGILGINVTITEDETVDYRYDSGLSYDDGEQYDLGCPPCSGYSLILGDPNNVIIDWEINPLIEAMLMALIKYVEPINARMTSWTYVGSGQYLIDLDSNIPSAGVLTGGGYYNEDETVTVSATPNEGYTFINWLEGGVVISTDSSITFTAVSSRLLIAIFELEVASDYRASISVGPGPDYNMATEVNVPYSEGTQIQVNTPVLSGYNYLFISAPTSKTLTVRNTLLIDVTSSYTSIGTDNRPGYYGNTIYKKDNVFDTTESVGFYLTFE